MQPGFSIGLGWWLYMRFSTDDQRYAMTIGAGGVVALVCAATAGIGCVVAGLAGGASIA